jgi:hypothetical protein
MSEQSFLRRTVFCCIGTFIEAKAGLFLLYGSNFRILVRKFVLHSYNFFATMNRFLLHWYIIEAKAGLRESEGTRVSTRDRRIAMKNPSEDAQSFQKGEESDVRSERINQT